MRVRTTDNSSGSEEEAEGDWIWEPEDLQKREQETKALAKLQQQNIQYMAILNPVSLVLSPLTEESWSLQQIIGLGENLFPFITLAKVKRIQFQRVHQYFHQFNHSQILGSICNIRFSNLLSLNLGENRIKSLEKIQKLEAVNLETLILQKNRIQQIKTLRKCYFPKLTALDIKANPIIDYWYLGQMELKSLKILVINQSGRTSFHNQTNMSHPAQFYALNRNPDYTQKLVFKINHNLVITDSHPKSIKPTVMQRVFFRKMIYSQL